MIYKLLTLLQHFTLFTTSRTRGNRLPDNLRVSPLREVSCRKHCKPEMSNTNESKELCYHARMVFFITYPKITNANQQRKIIQTCYADKLGGHFGRDKTLEKIPYAGTTVVYRARPILSLAGHWGRGIGKSERRSSRCH